MQAVCSQVKVSKWLIVASDYGLRDVYLNILNEALRVIRDSLVLYDKKNAQCIYIN